MYKNGFPCRCSYCRKRRTFKYHPETYSMKFEFLKCGCRKSKINGIKWGVDKYRLKKEAKKNNCNCEGYHFPHAKGKGSCIHNSELIEFLMLKNETEEQRNEREYLDIESKVMNNDELSKFFEIED